MPDLSSMLGDVYESDDDADTPPPAPSEPSEPADPADAADRGDEDTGDGEPGPDERDVVAPTPAGDVAAPDWADEDRLDEAFADWTPGPSADATDEEREMMSGADDDASGVIEPVLADRAEERLHEPDEDWEPPELTAPSPPRGGPPAPGATARTAAIDLSLLSTDTTTPARTGTPTDAVAEEPVTDVDADPEPAAEPIPPAATPPAPAPVAPAAGPWSRDLDDILPGGGPIGLLARLLR